MERGPPFAWSIIQCDQSDHLGCSKASISLLVPLRCCESCSATVAEVFANAMLPRLLLNRFFPTFPTVLNRHSPVLGEHEAWEAPREAWSILPQRDPKVQNASPPLWSAAYSLLVRLGWGGKAPPTASVCLPALHLLGSD